MRRNNRAYQLLILICSFAFAFSSCKPLPIVGTQNDNDTITYNDIIYTLYNENTIEKYLLGECLGKLENGTKIYSVSGDSDKNYICTHAWDGKTLYLKEGVSIPKNGAVTQIYTSRNKTISNKSDIDIIMALDDYVGDSYSFKVLSSGGASLYGCYESCPVATLWIGSITHIDGKWVFVSDTAIQESFELYSNDDNRLETGSVITDDNIIEVIKRTTGIK